jgi:hypothetical protein
MDYSAEIQGAIFLLGSFELIIMAETSEEGCEARGADGSPDRLELNDHSLVLRLNEHLLLVSSCRFQTWSAAALPSHVLMQNHLDILIRGLSFQKDAPFTHKGAPV